MVESIRRLSGNVAPEPVSPAIVPLLISPGATLFDALGRLDGQPRQALIVVDAAGRLEGVLDDAMVRAAILRTRSLDALVGDALPRDAGTGPASANAVTLDTPFSEVVALSLAAPGDLIPVLDDRDRVVNAFTREQLHQLLAEDLPWDPRRDFTALTTAERRPDAVTRPWGFYRSLLTTAFTQAKILSVAPGQELSLQKHFRREEYWTVVRGEGSFRLDDDRYTVRRGFTVHIPREAVHWIRNTHPTEALILVEVQAGDYFGEDDIVRLSDKYRRA